MGRCGSYESYGSYGSYDSYGSYGPCASNFYVRAPSTKTRERVIIGRLKPQDIRQT